MNEPDPNFVAVLSFISLFFISFLIHDYYTLRQITQTPYEYEYSENDKPNKARRIRYIPQVQSQKRKKR